jgi:hypothetical protein
MSDIAISRIAQWMEGAYLKREEICPSSLVDCFPDIYEIQARISWGVFSWRWLSRPRHRLIRKATTVWVRDNQPQTPSEVARDYLDYHFPKKLRATAAQARIITRPRSAPLFVRPCIIPDAAYVDIRATYFSFLNLVGWDIDYFPSRWLIPGYPPTDFPLPDHKIARNCLISLALPSSFVEWNGREFIRRATRNLHLNMGLISALYDALHSIAAFARDDCEAAYAHTDGYIIDAKHMDRLISHIAEWGFEARVKYAGFAYIFGMGNWKIGEKSTMGFRPHIGQGLDKIEDIVPATRNLLQDAMQQGRASLNARRYRIRLMKEAENEREREEIEREMSEVGGGSILLAPLNCIAG